MKSYKKPYTEELFKHSIYWIENKRNKLTQCSVLAITPNRETEQYPKGVNFGIKWADSEEFDNSVGESTGSQERPVERKELSYGNAQKRSCTLVLVLPPI